MNSLSDVFVTQPRATGGPPLAARVRVGIRWGLVMATVFSAWVTVVAVTGSADAFTKVGVTYRAVVAAYYAGGIVAGAIGGALLPLRRTFPGAALVGTVAALPVWMGIWFVSEGSPWRWQSGDWYGIALFSVVFGIAAGRLMRKDL
jgi:hypothetical protein